jgi:hypothetical protein
MKTLRALRCAGVLSLLASSMVSAETLYIPAAAHATGVGGARWRTDVEILAAGSVPVSLLVDLLERDRENASPRSVVVNVPAGTANRYVDALDALFSFEGAAALRLTPLSGSPLVTSRTYADSGEGTYGQFIPAVSHADSFAIGQTAALIQLSRPTDPTTGYRSNLGLVNLGAAPMTIEIDLRRSNGERLGTPTQALRPFEYVQIGDVFSLGTGGEVADGFALLRTTTSGGRFLAYASVVDNRTADAIFIPGRLLPAGASSRLEETDFTYRGAFRLPEAFDWGARGMTFSPSGSGGSGSLLVIGSDLAQAEFGEVAIPPPVVASDPALLPATELLAAMTDFDGNVVASVSPDTAVASGIAIVARQGSQTTDKLYGSIDQWYGVEDETHPTIWFSELDGSNPRGPFHVGPRQDPYHGNKSGDYLFDVPTWYAEQFLGGRTLVTGKTRGAFNGSMGPTLLAFRPFATESPSGDLDAVPMLWYRLLYPECAGPNVGDPNACDYPAFTMCDKWEGGAFLERNGRRAIALFGLKGLGPNQYGEPPSTSTCFQDKGYHCDPYERQLVLYDVDELGAVAAGARDPWSVDPYAIWRPSQLFVRDAEGKSCGEVGGVAVDAAGRRLFAIEKGIGENNSAVVHVWGY